MIPLHNRFFSPDGGAGNAGDGNAAGDGGATHWLDGDPEYADLSSDEGAKTTLAKYKTIKDALKGHVELQKQFRQSFRVPDNLADLPESEATKVIDRLKGILKPEHVRRFADLPDSPEGYALKLPEGGDLPIDEQALTEFKALAHADGVPQATAQKLVDLQLGMVKRLNAQREQVIQGMTDNNYKTFLKDDCGGDKELAATRMELVRRYLQSFCTKADGTPDPALWEKYALRKMYNDRFIELIDLRAHLKAAQMLVGTGGALATSGPGTPQAPAKIDVNARWPQSANVMK